MILLLSATGSVLVLLQSNPCIWHRYPGLRQASVEANGKSQIAYYSTDRRAEIAAGFLMPTVRILLAFHLSPFSIRRPDAPALFHFPPAISPLATVPSIQPCGASVGRKSVF